MALVQHFRKPAFFITFTGNPKWEEIQREIYLMQTAIDWLDLVVHVFYLRLKDLISLLKQDVFGQYLRCVSIIKC